jgi:hypothetical protein
VSSGVGQQVQRRALLSPEPGAMAISPGRRVFRRPTTPHRPCLLPASDQPTKQAGTARPEHIAPSPYSPPVWTAGQNLRAAGDPKATAGASYTVAVSISYVSCTARVGRPRPTKQVVDSPLGPFSSAGGTQLSGPGVNEGRLYGLSHPA